MDASLSSLAQAAPPAQSAPVADKAAPAHEGFSFHQVLSALNPLQYLPVVGTIYRAITGDTIPEGLRVVGSFVVSGLTGGPLGMILNAAATLAEKITGFDPEAIAHDIASAIGIGHDANPAPEASTVQEAGAPAPTASFTAGQLAAYDATSAARDAKPEAWIPAPISSSRHRSGLALYAQNALA